MVPCARVDVPLWVDVCVVCLVRSCTGGGLAVHRAVIRTHRTLATRHRGAMQRAQPAGKASGKRSARHAEDSGQADKPRENVEGVRGDWAESRVHARTGGRELDCG